MQANTRVPGQQAPVKIYNAVYSSVQVYECMVRGIAVMRRRADSYVNATQILKVAGVDKGRRTKILEKEILPGKHEIVQGGYGKYQGTWIPLERGRDIAIQYGVAPLLAPLFDFVPSTNPMGGLPTGLPTMGNTATPRPLSAASSYSSLGGAGAFQAGGLAPPPIMPGSALRLLNQGRAQGLFTPSTSTLTAARTSGYASPAPYYSGYAASPFGGLGGVSPTPPPLGSQQSSSLKRTRSDADGDIIMGNTPQPSLLAASPDIQMADRSRPSSTTPQDAEGPSPNKRARTEPSTLHAASVRPNSPSGTGQRQVRSTSPTTNGQARPSGSQEVVAANGKPPPAESEEVSMETRFATKPSLPRSSDFYAPSKELKRGLVFQTLFLRDDPQGVLDILHGINPENKDLQWSVGLVLDDTGHSALHLAASMARIDTVEALLAAGADMHSGNYDGETPLMRATLATDNYTSQTFDRLVELLHASIRTLDSSSKTVLHHIVAAAGVPGRSSVARYYLERVLYWVVNHQGGDFKNLIDIQDVHGDTALNIAARVGNRALVRALLDVGANRVLPNKLGLRPGDFGVETEELGGATRSEDLLSTLRTAPSGPVQKSQTVLSELENMVQSLSSEFSTEIKSKQDSLDVSQAHLRVATRELAEQRKQIQVWQSQCAELDLVVQRTKNLEQALRDEDTFDWTGRVELDGSDSVTNSGPAFQKRNLTLSGGAGPADISSNLDEEPPIPSTDSAASLIRLRRLKIWHERVEKLMEQRLEKLQGASAEREFQYKKIVSLCTKIPIDEIENMLDNLVIAMESDAHIVDISRVSGFMQKVRNGLV